MNRLRDLGVLIPRLLTLGQAATYLGLTADALKVKVQISRNPTVDIDRRLRLDEVNPKRNTRSQGSIYQRNALWWCDYSVGGPKKRESCKTPKWDEALAYLHRKQGKLASATLKVNSVLVPKLGDVKAAKLTSTRIKDYFRDRVKTVKASMVNREFALLHRGIAPFCVLNGPRLTWRKKHFGWKVESQNLSQFRPIATRPSFLKCSRGLRLRLAKVAVRHG